MNTHWSLKGDINGPPKMGASQSSLERRLTNPLALCHLIGAVSGASCRMTHQSSVINHQHQIVLVPFLATKTNINSRSMPHLASRCLEDARVNSLGEAEHVHCAEKGHLLKTKKRSRCVKKKNLDVGLWAQNLGKRHGCRCEGGVAARRDTNNSGQSV